MFLHRWEDLTLFSTVLPSNSRVFLSCRPFVVITKCSTGLVGVENVITTKGLQDRNTLLLDGRTVENKGKLILTLIFLLKNYSRICVDGDMNRILSFAFSNVNIYLKNRILAKMKNNLLQYFY